MNGLHTGFDARFDIDYVLYRLVLRDERLCVSQFFAKAIEERK